MYNNVYAAWNSFLENKVNLDPDIVKGHVAVENF